MKSIAFIFAAAITMLVIAEAAQATGVQRQRTIQRQAGGCAQGQCSVAVIQPQVVYAQPLVIQQQVVPHVQQQVVVQKQVAQKQRSSQRQRLSLRGGGRSSSLSIQRSRN